MAILIEETTQALSDTDFDRLWADSRVDIIDNNTQIWPDSIFNGTEAEKKSWFKQCLVPSPDDGTNYVYPKLSHTIKSDNVIVTQIKGVVVDNIFQWQTVLVGKVNNSKLFYARNELLLAFKTFYQGKGYAGMSMHCIKDSRVYNFFKGIENDSICEGTFSEQKVSDYTSADSSVVEIYELKWVY